VTSQPAADLATLSGDDLAALRLAAQVMAHRAQLAAAPQVALYFESLESGVMAEQAARAQSQRPAHDANAAARPRTGIALLSPISGMPDVQLANDYLELLSSNDGLSPAVRAYCLQLQRTIAHGRGAP